MAFKIILGSKSPRRQELIKALGFEVEIRTAEVEEIYPSDLHLEGVPEYLARLKAEPLKDHLGENELLLTSDTVVLLDDKLLGKPQNGDEAYQMIKALSGSKHDVLTGVYLFTSTKELSFTTRTSVYFDDLSDNEITAYIKDFSPFDKAGAYGIQEWIGYIGIKGIEGCYYNVMGLPLHDVYQAIKKHFS
jgi:septum formation protein